MNYLVQLTLLGLALAFNGLAVRAQSGYNYPRPDQSLGAAGNTGPSGVGGASVRPTYSPQQPTNDVFQTSPAITNPTASYPSTGYPSAGRPSGPAFVPGTVGSFSGPAPGAIGFDDAFSSPQRPSVPGATIAPFPTGNGPVSNFGSGFGSTVTPQGPFSSVAPTSPGASRPLLPGTRPTIGTTNVGGFGGSAGSQTGFPSTVPGVFSPTGSAPGSFGNTLGPSLTGAPVGRPTGSNNNQAGNNNAQEEGDYSAIPGEPGIDYPIYTEIPKTSFDCANQQWPGYYADVEAQCQVFHVCAMNRTFDFLCPNGTIFSQEVLVCVWWNQFDCSSAPGLYGNNAYIYDYSQQGQQRPLSPQNTISGQPGLPTSPSPTPLGSISGGQQKPFQGSTGPSLAYPGPSSPSGPSANYPSGGSTGVAPTVGYQGGPQGSITGPSSYPGSAQGNFPSGTSGPGVSYPSASQGAPGGITTYPTVTGPPPAFGGYPSSDQLFPSPTPPNREYLPPTRI